MSTGKRRYEQRARADARRATRDRIAAAAAELHEEVGVARTTVSDIARRAGVQRLTVYNHFPDLAALLPACTAHFLQRHPPPALDGAMALGDPAERVRAVLAAMYPYYRRTERMLEHVHGERGAVPELDAWLAESSDPETSGLADALAAGFGAGSGHEAQRALVAVALDFWTWQRLGREGLTDDAAAGLMADAVRSVAQAGVPARK